MRVSELMTRDVCVANPETNIQTVAKIMADENIGALPVGNDDRLLGMVTDRDIAVRAVALGKSSLSTRVGEVMSCEVKYCFEDEDVAHVAENMGDIQLHRLPVVSRDKRLVGILSLSDIARCEDGGIASKAIQGIADGNRKSS